MLLVTIDTLRRDRVGAFGGTSGLTAALDDLAANGIRYSRAYSNVPMTLPAHTSILTGLTPRHSGVRNNTTAKLDPSLDTLATILQHSGYRTGAFVSAFVLDARFGLARGFDVYDDRVPPQRVASFNVSERRASEVVQLAGDWIVGGRSSLDARGSSGEKRATSTGPWFAWIHLFDPHAPYAPPRECARGHSGYEGEVACADTAIGALLARLRAAHALDHTIIVVTADHGESLGEHGETTHGLFAYNATLAVPMLIAGAGTGVNDIAVSHVDLMPTILDIVGVASDRRLDGRSLAAADTADRPIYFEALDANLSRGWAPLTGVIHGGVKYIDLPDDELYVLDEDPGEQRNRVAGDARAAALRQTLRTLTADQDARAPAATLDADASARLRSLGYVRGTAANAGRWTSADDPKRLVALNERFNSALTAFDEGNAAAALDGFLAVLRGRPDFLTARTSAATVLLATGRGADAVRLLEETPAAQRSSPELAIRLGATLRELGRMQEAATVLESARNTDADDPDLTQNLATVYAALGRSNEARSLFQSLTKDERSPATAWYNLGLFELESRRPADATHAFERAVQRDPSYGEAWNALGASLVQRDPLAAAAAWRHAVELLPGDFDVLFNVGIVLAEHGRNQEADPYLRRFADQAPPQRYARDITRVKQLLARSAVR